MREALAAGHRFNCGVVYLPPSAARDGVAELIRVNPELRKIFIITEKISVHDAREIRAMGQQNGIDIFGANGLGVADSWNQVRIGGALGGDKPGDSLRPGSIAIFSNSGGFSTTIAQYLRMAGWGTTTVISSRQGRLHPLRGARVRLRARQRCPQQGRGAVLRARRLLRARRDTSPSRSWPAWWAAGRASSRARSAMPARWPAATTTRWPRNAGSWRSSASTRIFTPDNPVFSAKGALVTNIAHIPAALTAVMRANATMPDFAPEGNLALKPWFGSDEGLDLPDELRLPVVEALAPYNEQVALLNTQIGGVVPRQTMKDASGASQMDAKTQVSSLHGTSMLDAATLPLESNVALALVHDAGGENDRKLIAPAVAAYVNLHGRPELAAAQASREAGNAPNAVLAAAAAIVGPKRQQAARAALKFMIERFHAAGLGTEFGASLSESFDVDAGRRREPARAHDRHARRPRPGADRRRRRRAAAARCSCAGCKSLPGHPTEAAVLAAISATLAWGPLSRKRISRADRRELPVVAAAVRHADRRFGRCVAARARPLLRHRRSSRCWSSLSLGEIAFAALLGHAPGEDDLFAFQTLVGLLLTNGPGAISAQGAKGAVSADGPEQPERVQLNKALVGFLTHTGYAHGGNGYEGIAYLIDQFKDSGLQRPERHGPRHRPARRWPPRRLNSTRSTRRQKKTLGSLDIAKLPGVNHPVFKDKPVNHDPREVFIAQAVRGARRDATCSTHFYRALVQQLFDAGVSRNVYCVNVDAVIAALLLKMLWKPLQAGEIGERELETAAFTIFLYPRMLGCAAEIDDHLNRGRNMDTRTAASLLQVRGLTSLERFDGEWPKAGGIFGRKEEHCGPTLTEKRDANLNPGMH